MNMKNRPNRQWYARMIAETLDDDILIGPAVFPEDQGETAPQSTAGFATFVWLARRNRRLSVEQLAEKLAVEVDEVRKIESDPAYQARPRTIASIATFFELPPTEVMKLAGAAVSNDASFAPALKFAAHSEDMSALTKEEQVLLRDFIRFLRDKG
jgi:transcriptional regulator with XRE-family HTH domain